MYPHQRRCGKDYDQTFCTISPMPPNNTWSSHRIPELSQSWIIACNGGWCLLGKYDDRRILFLWNPVTLETISIPKLNLDHMSMDDLGYLNRRQCTFTCLQQLDDDGCSVADNFFILWVFPRCIAYCRPVDDGWSLERHDLGEDFLAKNLTFCNNKLYGTGIDLKVYRGTFFSIEFMFNDASFTGKLFNIQSYENLSELYDIYSSGPWGEYLVESCGDLYHVQLYYASRQSSGEVSEINVYKLDPIDVTWSKVKSLEGSSFFLGGHYSISCSASPGCIEGDAVYFCHDGDKTLYMYTLKNQSVTALLPCQNLRTPWGHPSWIMPNHSLGERRQVPWQRDIQQSEDVPMVMKRSIYWSEKYQRQETHFGKLPIELFGSIAKCLAPRDYLRFRSTCKEFHSAAPLPIKLGNQDWFPWLMFFKNDGTIFNLIDPSENDHFLMKVPQEWIGAKIRYSKNGWLVLFRDDYHYSFFNPMTGLSEDAPVLEYDIKELPNIAFSTDPSSSDCLTIGIEVTRSVGIHSFNSVDKEWTYHHFVTDKDFNVVNNCAIFYDGAFYVLDENAQLGVVKLAGDDCSWEVITDPPKTPKKFFLGYLIECNGDLLSVLVGRMGEWVRVFKFNHPKKNWIEVTDVGKHVLFVSPTSTFSTVAHKPEMENRIYFSRLHGRGIIYYSFITLKFHSSDTDEPVVGFYFSAEHLHCTWIHLN